MFETPSEEKLKVSAVLMTNFKRVKVREKAQIEKCGLLLRVSGDPLPGDVKLKGSHENGCE